VYSRPNGYWYARAQDATTGTQITDASGYSRENVLRDLRGKFAMIGVTIKSIADEDPYTAGPSSPHMKKKLDREIAEALTSAEPMARGSTAPRFEPGQRVDVVTFDGLILPGIHTVVDGSRWGLDESRFVRVRHSLHGGRATDDWPIDRVRPRR
jgi:hypothetical protein